jgi:hypothetical protein
MGMKILTVSNYILKVFFKKKTKLETCSLTLNEENVWT